MKARVLNGTTWSALDNQQFYIHTPASVENLAVTEVNYHPVSPATGSGFSTDDFQFIELKNSSTQTIDLTDVQLTLGYQVAFDFAGNAVTTLAPGGYVLIAEDREALISRYGSGIAAQIAGEFSGELSHDSERICLRDFLDQTIVDFTYSDSDAWPGRADGNGSSLEFINIAGDYNDPDNWRSSSEYMGSPGSAGVGPIVNVVVNEVLSHADSPLSDSIELYNTTDAAIDISGWYISDSNDDYKKYPFSNGTILGPYGYLVITEEQFGTYFGLNASAGDDVWLLEADGAGNLTYFIDHVEFGAAKNGESFGRWPNGTGDLYPLINRTFGQTNDYGGNGPRVGPLVISEVMYHPNVDVGQDPDDYEYIEIYNPTDAAVDLTNWRIRKGVDFDFANGTTIAAYGTLVVLPFDPSDLTKLNNFKNKYGIGSSVSLVGGFAGHLDNAGETVQLQRPDNPVGNPPVYPGLLEDEVNYDNTSPWPSQADGDGASLQRLSAVAWGDDPASWIAAAPTPGTLTATVIAGRKIFYNNSKFDWHTDYPNGDPAANVYDDNAIATNKQALLPGQTATSANYTSYSRGINGIIIDIQNPTNPLGLTAADFQFKVGNDNYPSGWSTGPAPSSVSVRQGQGAGGSDRVTITWDDIAGNSIKNQWLQVTVKANTNTGLSAADVFYFGNLIGESGSDAAVNTSDEQASRSNRTGFTLASVSNAYDYNRDRQVNASDDLIARHNSGASLWLLTGPLAAEDTLQPLALAAAPLVSSIATSIITPPAEVMPVALPFANSLLGDSGAMTASSSLPASDLLATKTMVFAYNLFEFNRLSQPLREISPPGKALADAGVQGAAAAFSSFEEIKRQAEQPWNAVFERALFHDAVFGQTAAGKDLEGELNADKINWLSDLEQTIIKDHLLKKSKPAQNPADAFLAGYQT